MYKNWIFLFSCFLSIIQAEISGDIRVCALIVSFQEDAKESTTGNGRFLNEIEGIDCGDYHLDPPPHDRSYFYSQLKSVHNYFRSVSYETYVATPLHANCQTSHSIWHLRRQIAPGYATQQCFCASRAWVQACARCARRSRALSLSPAEYF